MLKSPDVAYTVTNGQVKDCQLLFLGISDRPDDSWFGYDSEVASAYEQDPLILEFNSTLLDGEDELKEDLFLEVEDEDLDLEDIWDDEFWLDFMEEDVGTDSLL